MITEVKLKAAVASLRKWHAKAKLHGKKETVRELENVMQVIQDLYGRKIDV